MIVDEEFRHSLGDRRFELPDNHPAHRRMRELLMSEVEIAEFESFHQENNQAQIRWDHNRLKELELVSTRGKFGLFSRSSAGSRPAWCLLKNMEQDQEEGVEGHHFEPNPFQFDVDKLLANRRPLSAALATDGTEALAWYIPFHSNSDEWGIYIRDIGPRVIANRCFPELVRTNPNEANQLGYDFLFAHEFFHHISELACTTLENAYPSNPLYYPYFNRLVSGHPDEVLEEAVANAHALEFIPLKKNKDGLRRFMDNCPPGYRDYADFSNDLRFERGLDWLASLYTGASFSRSNRYPFGHGLFHHPTVIFKRMEVPVHDAWDGSSPSLPALPMCYFRSITVSEGVKKKLKKLGDPILKKKFYKAVDNLRKKMKVLFDKNLHRCNKSGWWKYNLGRSGDAHGNPRFFLVEKGNDVWEITWVGRHPEYERYRKKHSL